MKRVARALLAGLAVMSAPPVLAQSGAGWVPVLSAGTRVRATVTDSTRPPVVGTYLGTTPDSLRLMLTPTTTLALPARSLLHVDVSEGRPRARWALLGAVAGAIGGGLIGAAAMSGDSQDVSLAPVAGFLAGMVLGTPTGAVVGALVAPEQWTRFSNPR